MNRRALLTGSPAAAAASATLMLRHSDGRELELELDFGVLRLQPGDRVVISAPAGLNFHALERIREQLGPALPPGVTAIVLSDGIHIEGILRGQP